ncbi:MAG: hypothetical protein JW715_04450 [Sedimentisphaerales bacterium]|nr:hypothetical protein [Sedimentisphaerales bacterium]
MDTVTMKIRQNTDSAGRTMADLFLIPNSLTYDTDEKKYCSINFIST